MKMKFNVKTGDGINLVEATGITAEHFNNFMNKIGGNKGYDSVVRGVMDALKEEENLNALIAVTVILYQRAHREKEALVKEIAKSLGVEDGN